MGIFKYKVINPTTNAKLPFFDEKKGIFYIPLSNSYRYYVETVVETKHAISHYLLLSKTKFDVNCRLCHTDNYGRVQIKVKGRFKDFIIDETKERGNLIVEYVESIENYDVFIVV